MGKTSFISKFELAPEIHGPLGFLCFVLNMQTVVKPVIFVLQAKN